MPEISYTQLLLGRVADQLERDKRELQQEIEKLKQQALELQEEVERLEHLPCDCPPCECDVYTEEIE